MSGDIPKGATPLAKWRLLAAIHADPELSQPAKLAAFVLLSCHNNTTGKCFPSYTTIAERAAIQRRTAIKAVNQLVERGWFRRISGRG